MLIIAQTVQKIITLILESVIHATDYFQVVVNVQRQVVSYVRKDFILMETSVKSALI